MDNDQQPHKAAMNFGDWVRQRRLALGMRSQGALAEAMTQVGPDVITNNYVWQLESGKIRLPQQPRLTQLARALDTTVAEVLRITGNLVGDEDADEKEAAFDSVPPSLRASFLMTGELTPERQAQLAQYIDDLVTLDRLKRRSQKG